MWSRATEAKLTRTIVMSNANERPEENMAGRGNMENGSNSGDPGSNGSGGSRSHFTIAINYATLSGNGEQNGASAGTGVFPPMIFRFADVPSDTSSGRLNEVIALASEYIFQTLTRDQRRQRGLTREAFEKLELRDVDTLEDNTCAICYDELTNDPKDFANLSSKRSREGENGDGNDDEGNAEESVPDSPRKRQRTVESEEEDLNVDVNPDPFQVPGPTPTPTPTPISTTATEPAEPAGPANTTTTEPNLDSAPNTNNSPNSQGEDASNYGHSATVLPCGHIFGRDCLFTWTTEHNSCPICRASILSEDELNDVHNRENESAGAAMNNGNGPDAAQQSTFESIRRLLYERSPEPAVANNIAERNSNTNINNTGEQSTSSDNSEHPATGDSSNTSTNTGATDSRQAGDATQDITNTNNNTSRSFSTSFIFFLSDIHAHPRTTATMPNSDTTGANQSAGRAASPSPATNISQGSFLDARNERSNTNTNTDTNTNTNTDTTTERASTGTTTGNNTNNIDTGVNGPTITHFNDLPEDNRRLLGNIRAILRRAQEERNSTGRPTDNNEQTANSQNNTGAHDLGQNTRRFFNLLPLLGRRQQSPGNNETNTTTPSNSQPPSTDLHTDPALENRYSAYLEHLNTLRNGNRPPTESTGSRFRLPSFFRLGRQQAAHRHEGGRRPSDEQNNVTNNPLLNPNANLFSSGVASYRHANGVRTVNFTGDIPEPPSATNTPQANQQQENDDEQQQQHQDQE